MTKLQNIHTNDNSEKHKRRVIKNSTYAIILACSILLGATLVAVNVNKESTTPTLVETSVNNQQYASPLDNATVIKDYNSKQLQYNTSLKQWEIHKAMDLTSENTKVFAIASGTVTDLYTNYLEGTVIKISHSDGLVSVYKSLGQDVKVKLGDYIKQGDCIGYTATTMSRESSIGNHLHFELFLNNVAVNPNDYIDFSKK